MSSFRVRVKVELGCCCDVPQPLHVTTHHVEMLDPEKLEDVFSVFQPFIFGATCPWILNILVEPLRLLLQCISRIWESLPWFSFATVVWFYAQANFFYFPAASKIYSSFKNCEK
jgi:hypothetical protein